MAEGLAHRAEGTGHSVKGGKKEVEKVRWWEGIEVGSGNAEVGIEGHGAVGMGHNAGGKVKRFEDGKPMTKERRWKPLMQKYLQAFKLYSFQAFKPMYS